MNFIKAKNAVFSLLKVNYLQISDAGGSASVYL